MVVLSNWSHIRHESSLLEPDSESDSMSHFRLTFLSPFASYWAQKQTNCLHEPPINGDAEKKNNI